MTEEGNGGHLPPLCSAGGAIGEDCGNSPCLVDKLG